ncbi:MAG TPA: hypothetical protein VK753_10180 [Xanthomonadaceae bacterium]|nr:hypothetical protein [Xanthomonadaceae bacterium]
MRRTVDVVSGKMGYAAWAIDRPRSECRKFPVLLWNCSPDLPLCSVERQDFQVEKLKICRDRQVVRQISRGSREIFARVVRFPKKSPQQSWHVHQQSWRVHQHATMFAGSRRNLINKDGESGGNLRDTYGSAGMLGELAGDPIGFPAATLVNARVPHEIRGFPRESLADPACRAGDSVEPVAGAPGSSEDPIGNDAIRYNSSPVGWDEIPAASK